MKNQYKEVDGIYYHQDTSVKVAETISDIYKTGRKLKIYFGDVNTGLDWCEEYDTIGTIGRSNGTIKVPLLLPRSRSVGGTVISTQNIVKIIDFTTKEVLYQHPLYHRPEIKIETELIGEYVAIVKIGNTTYSRHKSIKSAEMLLRKLK